MKLIHVAGSHHEDAHELDIIKLSLMHLAAGKRRNAVSLFLRMA